MTLSEFFWLDDAKFAQQLTLASDDELRMRDKHNVRKRKGGKLGAWVGTAQAPVTMGISLVGTGIGIRNRAVAKRRLEMIHAELRRRGLEAHIEDWKDAAFATVAVGAGAAVGMGFVPGAEAAAQGLAEAGATTTAQLLAGAATSQVAQSVGSQITEVSTAHYTDPDTYFLTPEDIETGTGMEMGMPGYWQLCAVAEQVCSTNPFSPHGQSGAPTPMGTPAPSGHSGYMSTPPAPYYS